MGGVDKDSRTIETDRFTGGDGGGGIGGLFFFQEKKEFVKICTSK